MAEQIEIRKAVPGDEVAIMGLVQELAEYEKEPDAVINTPEQLAIDLFKDKICDSARYGFVLYFIFNLEREMFVS